MFRLLGRLEGSELSELYRAERTDGGPVVLKLFHPRTTDVAYAKVIADYAQRLSSVSVPGFARVLQVGLFQRRLAIVREDVGRYTLGQALTRLNTREVVLPPAVAIAFIIELADVLEAAHRASVVHGALTPGNVLLGSNGRAAIADFGALDALIASPVLKKAFADRGRSSYRAPEVRGAGRATASSDIYALGALAYELLTLKEASVGRDSLSTRQGEKLPPPSRLVRRLHSRIDPIIMRALEQTPGRRQRSAGELSSGLREFLSEQGGVPGREDVRKFVDELFPKDVVTNALGPVPFQGAFELDDIAGVSDLVADAELPAAPQTRAPFSGGTIDDRTATSDGLPIFPGDDVTRNSGAETQELPAQEDPSLRDTVRSPPITWDAPAGAMPRVAQTAGADEEVSRRVRAIEDFAPKDTPAPTSGPQTSGAAQKLTPAGPMPKESTERQKLKTLVTFAVPFKRPGDSVPPDWKKEREARRRAGVTAVRLGAAILTLFTMVFVSLWLFRTQDAIGDLITWMPEPIEVALIKLRRPNGVGPPGPPLALPPNLKLPNFDKPPKNPPPSIGTPAPVKPADLPTPAKPLQPPTPRGDCYAPPHEGPQALLTVVLTMAARVELDGVRVCGVINKVPVIPGKHTLRVVDSKTKQEWKSTVHLETGKQAKVDPNFR